MSASFYDILKYAKTGLASPGMTAYDKMRAVAMAGGKVKTLTGVPPLSFKSNGMPLISWSMKGNSQQNGTPAPDAPIMPTFCGERSANLFDKSNADIYDNSTLAAQNLWDYSPEYTWRVLRIPCNASTQYTISFNQELSNASLYRISILDTDSVPTSGETGTIPCHTYYTNNVPITRTITTGVSAKYILLQINGQMMDSMCNALMINEGATPLPYEPYGWKIPVTSAGQTQNVYLGEVQTTRKIKKLVLDGTENWEARQSYDSCDRFVLQKTFFTVAGQSGYCSHFETLPFLRDNYPVMIYNNGQQIVVNYSTKGTTTLAQFKQWLSDQYAAGTPVTVWYVMVKAETVVVNEPLAKIGNYADELHSEDAEVSIPTAKGANTLTVDTDLKPSSMTITYRG